MTPSNFTAPSLETMNALIPAFEFKALIASNELSVVYMANQRSLDRQVAIKLLSPHVSESAEFRKSFEVTARMMARLNHPNLIGVYDSGLVDGMLYFVMEFVPGKSLARSAKGQQVDVKQALGLISGISAGLTHAHEHGIVHGDLNPGNVLLNQKAEPKVGNFGATHGQPNAAQGVGSPYSAPETSKQGPSVSGDIFALGAILYELLTGHPHREGARPPSTLSKCGEAIDALWKKATHPDPTQRFSDVKSFSASLPGSPSASRTPKAAGMAPATKLKPAAAPPISEKLAKPAKGLAIPARADATDEPAPPPPTIKVGFNWKLVRNLIIIGGLLYAISLAWENYKRTKTQREREHADAVTESQAAKEKKRLEELKQAEERRKNAAAGSTGGTATPAPTPRPNTESPEASLARLRNDLYAGERGELPIGSISQGDHAYFLVKEAMSWPEASWFAEKHGASVAIPNASADLAWLLSKMASEEIGIWIGAARSGRSEWRLADGELWKPKKEPSGMGQYLALDKNGLLRAEGLKRKLPFVLQWRNDGKNPSQLETLLAKTSQSLSSSSPAFPPGTISLRNRHFLYVARPALWEDAIKVAKSAGAILAVPSDTYELTDIAEITREANAPNGIWLGGFRMTGAWQWMSGEPWKTPKWANGVKDDATNRRVVIRPATGLDHLPPTHSASGFLLEWSSDAKGTPASAPETSASPSGNAEFDALTNRARDLVTTADRKRSDQLASNAKTFTWDLDNWLKGLPRSENTTWAPHVSQLKTSVSKNRVPSAVPLSSGIKLSPNMSKIAQDCASRQERIDAEFLAEANRVRTSYTAKVRDMLSQALKAGKGANAKVLSEALDQSSTSEKWLSSFGIDAKPQNPVPGNTPAASSSRPQTGDGNPRSGPSDSLIE
jgi:serine/threonine protein kinase